LLFPPPRVERIASAQRACTRLGSGFLSVFFPPLASKLVLTCVIPFRAFSGFIPWNVGPTSSFSSCSDPHPLPPASTLSSVDFVFVYPQKDVVITALTAAVPALFHEEGRFSCGSNGPTPLVGLNEVPTGRPSPSPLLASLDRRELFCFSMDHLFLLLVPP